MSFCFISVQIFLIIIDNFLSDIYLNFIKRYYGSIIQWIMLCLYNSMIKQDISNKNKIIKNNIISIFSALFYESKICDSQWEKTKRLGRASL